jgi:solute carrier family 38 (sodium-coupled neutral amino acid transporter), member 11
VLEPATILITGHQQSCRYRESRHNLGSTCVQELELWYLCKPDTKNRPFLNSFCAGSGHALTTLIMLRLRSSSLPRNHVTYNLTSNSNDVMAKDSDNTRAAEPRPDHGDKQEAEGLLQSTREGSPDEDIIVHPAVVDDGNDDVKVPMRGPPRRQSSFAQPRPNGEPRTPRRVRFEFAEPEPIREGHGGAHGENWVDEEDYFRSNSLDEDATGPTGQRAPLLTGIEAPSVAVANELDFNPEDHLESARPKSGLKSAFMNMANSIIGAGIIGQPYAFKQAGLFTGVFLLIALTVTVDWTIRLIVTNSKLSGADSFQATMEKCFGKSGLIAISVAQWAFAFGGMVAFCIIIGDTIPHVLAAVLPSLETIPVLWLLTDRRAIIVLFVLGFSYPLSLYRDIALVRPLANC